MLNEIKDDLIKAHLQEKNNLGHVILTVEFTLHVINAIVSRDQSENLSKKELIYLLQKFYVNLDETRNELVLNWAKQNESGV